jgi:hypothetical protein
MRKELPGFYRPTDAEFATLWRTATIVVDANVLLNVYRFPSDAKDDLLNTFKKLADRLWIPFQVAAEFQRNRVKVIQDQRKNLAGLRKLVSEAQGKIDSELLRMEISRRTGVDLKDHSDKLRDLYKQIDSVIAKALEDQPSPSLEDPIRDQLDTLFAGKVGPSPQQQGDVDNLNSDAARRYSQLRPPGFKDAAEKKDIRYVLGGLVYEAQYGDFIVWRQLLDHANGKQLKTVIFVTSDAKEDWWQVIDGKTIGPHPELTAEIRKSAGVDLFWMYEVSNFLTFAKKFIGADVKEQSIREVRDVERLDQESYVLELLHALTPKLSSPADDSLSVLETEREHRNALAQLLRNTDSVQVEKSVLPWLQKTNPGASVEVPASGFPDFLVKARGPEGNTHGYEVKHIGPADLAPSSRIKNAILRGYASAKRGAFQQFTLILVFSRPTLSQLAEMPKVIRQVDDLASSSPITSIVLGVIDSGVFTDMYTGAGGGLDIS